MGPYPKFPLRYGRRGQLGVKAQEIVRPGALCEAGGGQTTSAAEEATRMDMHRNAPLARERLLAGLHRCPMKR